MNFKVVVAIDVGMTRTGYVCAIRDNNGKFHIINPPGWAKELKGLVPDAETTWKNITGLLYNIRDRKYEYWGAAAYDKYQSIKFSADNGYLYIDLFKTQLTKNFPNKNDDAIYTVEYGTYPQAMSSDGKLLEVKLRVVDLIAETLRFVKHEALREIKKTQPINEESIRWVITVPASWSGDSSNDRGYGKDLMRKAARLAGIVSYEQDKERLLLISEAEAASIFCLHEKKEDIENDALNMILDCGGGTTDILTVDVGRDRISEFIEQDSKLYGSVCLDELFRKFLITRLRHDYGQLQKDIIPDSEVKLYSKVKRKWAIYKCTYDSSSSFGNFNLDEIDDFFKKSKECHEFTKQDFEYLFDEKQEHIKGIFEQIENQLKKIKQKGRDCQRLLVVGGYSNSKMLQQKLNEKFHPDNDGHHLTIKYPDNDGNAVLKGAVYFGINPDKYRKRIATHTYGIEYLQTFVERIDKEEYRIERFFKKDDLCRNRFIPFITKGNVTEIDKLIGKSLRREPRASKRINQMELIIYKTDKEDIRYTTDTNCKPINTLIVEKPKNWNSKDWQIKFQAFCNKEGQIELEIWSENKSLNEKIKMQRPKINIYLELKDV